MALVKDAILTIKVAGFAEAERDARAFGRVMMDAGKATTDAGIAGTRAAARLQAVGVEGVKAASNISRAFEGARAAAGRFTVGLLASSGALYGIFRLLEGGAAVENVSQAFQHLATRAGGAATVLETLRAATKGTVDDQSLMLGANRLLIAGLDLSADRMGRLASIAVALGKATGTSAKDAFEEFATAVETGRSRTLESLGVQIDMERAMRQYTLTTGLSSDQISEHTKRMIFLEQVEKQAPEALRALGFSTNASASAVGRLSAQFANLKNNFMEQLASMPGLTDAMSSLATALGKIATAIIPLIRAFSEFISMASRVPGLLPALIGAAAGFSVAGPWGAAIGAGAGLVTGIGAEIFGSGGRGRGGASGGSAATAGASEVQLPAGGAGGAGGAGAGQGGGAASVTVPVILHEDTIDATARAVGEQVAGGMRRRLDDVRGSMARMGRKMVDGAFDNAFQPT